MMTKNESSRKDDNIHGGHRERMRAKLALHGDRVFHTYELLEMFIYSVVPLKNTNPAAKNLMKKFNDINGVFSASREQLLSVDGIGERTADMIISVGNFAKILTSDSDETVVRESLGYMDIGKYLVDKLRGSDKPTVAILLLNSRLEIIGLKELYSAEFSSAAVKPDAFVNAAVESGAVAAITANTNLYSVPFPLPNDMQTVKMIKSALSTVGVELLEHYSISGSAFTGIVHNVSNLFFKNKQISPDEEEGRLNE